MIKETSDGVIAVIKIAPNSGKNEIIKNDSGTKIKITAQPVEGKANKALIELLSKTFRIPKTSIDIVRGETSKEKTILFRTKDIEKISKIKSML